MPTAEAHGAATERDLIISQLEDEVYRLTSLLNASALTASSLDPDTVLKELVQQAAIVLRARAASLLLLDEEAGELVFRVAYGEKGADLMERRFPRDAGIAGQVVTTGEPLLIQSAQGDPRHLKQFDEELGFSTGSMLAVPVQAQGKLLGVLEVLNPVTESAFTEDDLTLLIAHAVQTGIALSNAQAHSDVRGQLAHVIRSMQDGMILLDGRGRVTLVNPAARRMFGLGKTAPVAATDLARAAGVSDAFGPVQEARTTELVTGPAGDRHARTLQINAAPMRSPAGEQVGTILVVHDISRQRDLDRLKNELIATISHELRTPVASIQGGAQLLAEGTVDSASEEGRRFVEIIQRNADRLATVVTGIVDLAQLASGSLETAPERCALSSPVTVAAEAALPAIRAAGLTLLVDMPTDLPPVWADSHRVVQALQHLLDNARKFTPPDGQITVSASADDAWVTVCVADSGPGIAPEERDQAFATFERLSDPQGERTPGSGLGLPIARGIIEALGGRMWIEPDAPTGGAEIAFTLPRQPPNTG